jgi:hypothetical protein
MIIFLWTLLQFFAMEKLQRRCGMITARENQRFCGREFTRKELSLVQEVVETCAGISRTELAHTVCELLEWRRANGGLKARECLELLGRLEGQGFLKLPERQQTGPRKGTRRHIAPVTQDPPWAAVSGSVGAFLPLDVELVKTQKQRQLFKDLVSRYHYLGYAMAFGARLQYLIYVNRPRRQVIGCVQFSSPAWRMKARDQWDPGAQPSAYRKQQSAFDIAENPQLGQHAAVLCASAAALRLAAALWAGAFSGGNPGGSSAILRRMLSGVQFYRTGRDQRSGANGPEPSAQRTSDKNRTGLSAGQKCTAPTAGRRVKGDECIGQALVFGAGL